MKGLAGWPARFFKKMESPEDLYYSPEHEWLRIDGQNVFIGLTGFAASALGDIIFVDIMGLGKLIPRGGVYGTVEAVKTVYD
ncbi:MAG: hypothetical protein JKY32_08090, partial [Rhizobiales bacterium]|nr:hypothetical protein [Hyphomicrobiales bacterium]